MNTNTVSPYTYDIDLRFDMSELVSHCNGDEDGRFTFVLTSGDGDNYTDDPSLESIQLDLGYREGHQTMLDYENDIRAAIDRQIERLMGWYETQRHIGNYREKHGKRNGKTFVDVELWLEHAEPYSHMTYNVFAKFVTDVGETLPMFIGFIIGFGV